MSILIFLVLIGAVVFLMPYIIIGFVMVCGGVAALFLGLRMIWHKLTGK